MNTKKIFIILIAIIALLLSGIAVLSYVENKADNSKSTAGYKFIKNNYYLDLDDRLKQDEEEYFVYYFSPTCGACTEIIPTIETHHEANNNGDGNLPMFYVNTEDLSEKESDELWRFDELKD